jgi:hypothetical protein
LLQNTFFAIRNLSTLLKKKEIYSAINAVKWSPEKVTAVSKTEKEIAWQEAFNRHFEVAFEKIGGRQPESHLQPLRIESFDGASAGRPCEIHIAKTNLAADKKMVCNPIMRLPTSLKAFRHYDNDIPCNGRLFLL